MLVTGGANSVAYLNSTELYDSSKGVWTISNSMNYSRLCHTASMLTNGKVLVTGGLDNAGSYLNSTELYQP